MNEIEKRFVVFKEHYAKAHPDRILDQDLYAAYLCADREKNDMRKELSWVFAVLLWSVSSLLLIIWS